jgi:hypothetical protein
MFKPTYLYIKTHNITGLKYFGKTISDPHKYKGSGTRWLNHLSVHGNNVTTEILGYYEVLEECINAALDFSERNKIVENEDWANLVIEDGIDGFTTDHGKRVRNNWENLSEDEKQIRRENSNPWKNKSELEINQYKTNLKNSMIDMYRSDAGKELINHKQQIGKSLLVNGKRILSEEARQKMRESANRTNEIRKIKKCESVDE